MARTVRKKNGARSDVDQTISRLAEAPTEEEIALRAYEIYLDRGQVGGMDLDDWLRAELELTWKWAVQPRKTEA
jgi:outer membrane protein TolC